MLLPIVLSSTKFRNVRETIIFWNIFKFLPLQIKSSWGLSVGLKPIYKGHLEYKKPN